MDARRVAAVAAVLRYLQRRRQLAGQMRSAPQRPAPWALYGRQALMNQRIRMQARRRA